MGVPRELIVQDYMLSNQYLKTKNDRMLAALKGRIDPALIQPLLEEKPQRITQQEAERAVSLESRR